ncbi:arylsulfatase [Novipirellula caenicola]|uniref:Arylsulfatase n=1 Tax=Novipirellula caenicola TaxID=1536901 RepID=A0ABP9VTZ8_9BACT
MHTFTFLRRFRAYDLRVPAILLLFGIAISADVNAANRPNIVLMVADDMGYSDPGCFGGEIATPNIDQLAHEGVRLTHFYNGGMCVVSRAMMFSGQWWPAALPAFNELDLLPEQLHDSGYRSALIGKWHLDGHPMDHGFDHFFGFLTGFADHFAGAPSYRIDRKPFRDFGDDFYSSDALSDRAIKFIHDAAKQQPAAPFFLCLSYQSPHNPLQAPREDIMKYRGRYAAGWQAVREARFERQKELGLIADDAVLPAYPQNLPDWNSLSEEQRDLEDLRMSVFAAMVERMDHGIGRVMDAVRSSGFGENTLVLFLSDNGSDSFSVLDDAMLQSDRLPGDRGSNWQLGTGWAYASVTPWRMYKIGQHAGGVTTGAVAWWPGHTGTAGRIDSRPVHVVDVLPTLLDLIGNDAPSAAGESFLPLLQDRAWQREQPLYFQYMDNRAIRTDRWTLAEVDGAGWQLLDNQTDPLETTDLAVEKPELVGELNAKWLAWWQEQSGSPNYQPQSTKHSPHYHPQGDRGTGVRYVPSAMPKRLSARYATP